MASHVIVMAPDNRRIQVKTTPSMALGDVLSQACNQFNLSSIDMYQLKRSNTRPNTPAANPLDLSLPIRLTNLSPGAKLDLIRRNRPSNTENTIKVALQLDSGGRIIDTYPGTTSLWHILCNTENRSNGTLNLTRREGHPKDGSKSVLGLLSAKLGDPQYMIPVMIVSNREFSTLNDLRNTTLTMVGAQGSVLIRLVYKYSGRKLVDVLPELDAPLVPINIPEVSSQLKQSNSTTMTNVPIDSNTKMSCSPSPSEPNVTLPPEPVQIPDTNLPESMLGPPTKLADTSPNENQEELSIISRQPTLYLPPSESSLTKIELPDSFFELTATELKATIVAQQLRRKNLENTPLKTSAMREKEERERRAKFPKTLIRVKCPDEYLLQLTFFTEEKISELYSTIHNLISSTIISSSQIRLVTTAPKIQDLDSNEDFWTSNLAPASVIRLVLVNGCKTPWSSVTLFSQDKVGPAIELPTVTPDVETSTQISEPQLGNSNQDIDNMVPGDMGNQSHTKEGMMNKSGDQEDMGKYKERKKILPKWFRAIK